MTQWYVLAEREPEDDGLLVGGPYETDLAAREARKLHLENGYYQVEAVSRGVLKLGEQQGKEYEQLQEVDYE